MSMEQATIPPVCLRSNELHAVVEVGIGRDMTLTYRGRQLVMVEVNGLQYAPLAVAYHRSEDWFKRLVKGGMDPVMKDLADIDRMILNYLFDAAVKTRLGEGENQ